MQIGGISLASLCVNDNAVDDGAADPLCGDPISRDSRGSLDSIICAVEQSIMSRRTRVGLIFLAAVVSACGGDNIVTPVPPPRLAIVSGDNQFATIGQALPTPLTVSLTSAAGDPVVGETVSWSVMNGSGTLSAASAITDADGRASVNWTLGNENGSQLVQASVLLRVGPGDNGFSSFGVTFSANAGPLPPPPPTLQPVILHYDGNAWSVALQAMSNTGTSLGSVWGASSSAIFAVGSQCGRSLLLRYDGSDWTPQLAQTCTGSGMTDYASVWGSSASDVFAIERGNNSPMLHSTFIYHFDGATWNLQYSHSCTPPTCDPNLNAVWGSSPSNVIAVGDSGLIVHYDGATWTPQTSGTTQHLNAVWGTGSGTSAVIFALGNSGTILSFDGSSWHAQTSGTTQPLYGVWGSSPGDVFAVGGGGTILHYDGTAWRAQSSGSTQALRGVWGNSGSSVYVVGDANTILHYDGMTWTPQTAPASTDLLSIWGSSPTNLFAVGRFR